MIRRETTADLRSEEIQAIRELVWTAFAADPEPFTEEDWEHALGGIHFILEQDGIIAAHASVIERDLRVDEKALSTGYVEAVATRRDRQGRGFGSAVMRAVGEYIDETFPLGALDTGLNTFYERLGWVTWKGPTFVRTASGLVRTEEDDGNVMVRRTPTTPEFDLAAPISCEWRSGDVW